MEKEALAITWTCRQFSDYVLGRKFTIESDNKPLIPLLSSDLLPSCIVRLHLRLAKFDYIVNHVPGKLLHTADSYSAPCTLIPEVEDAELEEEVQASVDSATQSLPAMNERLDLYKTAQAQDPVCSQVRQFCERVA